MSAAIDEASVSYPTRAVAFAERAGRLIASEDPADWFYAALEVRLGVEARLQAYISAARVTDSSIKAGWEIGTLAKGLERAFKAKGTRIVEMLYKQEHQEAPFVSLRFVPIPPTLVSASKRLGDYLHYREDRTPYSPKWWKDFREHVRDAQILLLASAQGDLLGPPLWKPEDGQVKLQLEFHKDDNRVSLLESLFKSREALEVSVTYIDHADFMRAWRQNFGLARSNRWDEACRSKVS